MLYGKGCFNADSYSSIREPVSRLVEYCVNCQKQLKEIIAASGGNLSDNRLVSKDEMTALLDGI
jgi:hypothetical protein